MAIVLIAGATGSLGGTIARLSIDAGLHVRALVRASSNAARVAGLEALGATIVEGDLTDRVSLASACRGADAVITTVTAARSRRPGDSLAAVDGSGQIDLVQAAAASGVSRFVYVSVSSGIVSDDPLTAAKRTVEARVRRSGMAWTILRPTYFMESWLAPAGGFDVAGGRVRIAGPGRAKISWISERDVAEFAVRSLSTPAAENAVLELGGPEPLSPLEVVAMAERLGGAPIEVSHLSLEELHQRAQDASGEYDRTFAAILLAYAAGDPVDAGPALARIPVRLTTVEEHLERVLAG